MKKKVKCVTKAHIDGGEDLWLPSMSVSQIIIYLFLIYAITLRSKLCKIDINLSRWGEHANNVEAPGNVFWKKKYIFFTNHERTADSSSREKGAMSDALKMKQIWHKFSKAKLKAEIMMWKMREAQSKKLALGKNYRDLQSQI